MKDDYEILRELAAGASVDATESLKALLENFGLKHQSNGDQLSLVESLELLDPQQLFDTIRPEAKDLITQVDLRWTIGSTNTEVLSLANSESFQGSICLAEQQTAGRGRRGRHWVSPFGKNIYLTVGWIIPANQPIEGLSLAVGTCVAKAITSVSAVDVKLKWPNDILLNGGKTAGILVELAGGVGEDRKLVVGVGINLALSDEDAQEIDQPWSVIDQVSRNTLVACLISELAVGLDRFADLGFGAFREEWSALDLHCDQEVNIISHDNTVSGVSRGVDEVGNLLVETDKGLETFNAGEVSLRGRD